MPLKPISVVAPTAAKKSKSTTPVVSIKSILVGDFVKADIAAKDAAAALAEVKPLLTEVATKEYFKLRASGVTTSSIKLEDSTGAVARFDFKSQYKAVDGAAAEAVFEGVLEADVNEYVQEQVKVTFNNDVFFNSNGDFDSARYDAFFSAISVVAAKLGVVNPLNSTTLVTAKPSFHEKRFIDFNPEQNEEISKVLGNTTALVALTPPTVKTDPDATVIDDTEEV